MAAFNHVRDLYDVALKPLLIRSLLKEQLPDETRRFPNPAELPFIVSTVKLHQLLSESAPDSADQRHVSSWRSSVDAWIDRISMLAASELPDKCWVGICLLGVTCAECSSDRFLASYSNWLNVLLQHIQSLGDSTFVKVASFAAVSDLLTRLGGFSNVKKDGTLQAGKLVHPILKTLNEDGNEAVLEAATQLLCTILIYFPSSLLRCHDNAEGAIVSRLMSGSCSVNSSKKLAFCLASLPKSRGDEESWSVMMQKILLSLSDLMNDALEGLEDESRRYEAVSLLVPPGTDHPPSLGSQMMPEEALSKGKRPHQLLTLSISSLMQSCRAMLTTSFPVQVAVPVRTLLAVIRRVLTVNGSLPQSLQPFTTAMQQESVCSQLPLLHLNALEVLAAVVKGIRSLLLPYAADVLHILMGYLKRCQLPELRTMVYSIIRVLLISMGVGMALHIFQEVISNGYIDLTFGGTGSNGVPINESMIEATLQCRTKKRKHGSAGGLMEQHPSFGLEVKAADECPTLIALKIAAVEALEALLVVGGALKSDGWSRRLYHLLVQVAMNACRGVWSDHGKPVHLKETRSTWEDFQLVALRALLASLLSAADVRPPHLAQGLELFNKGKQGTGSKVAEFCAQALLALEVLVHPRVLPLTDKPLQYGNNYEERTDFGGMKYKSPNADAKFRATSYGNPHGVYDFLNDIYVENGAGSEVPAAEGAKSGNFDENSADISRREDLEEPKIVNGQSDEMVTGKEDLGPAAANDVIQTEADGDRVMHHEEPGETSWERGFFLPVSDAFTTEKNTSDIVTSGSVEHASASEHVPAAKGIASTLGVTTRANNNTLKLSVAQPDNESSDSFPDIVDADPDTDSD